jgi:uridylate kinase
MNPAIDGNATQPYRRVMLKISGESLGGEAGQAFGPGPLADAADQIKQLTNSGVQCAVVVGGGNLFRAQDSHRFGISTAVGDQLGMMATGMNATMLEGLLQERGVAAQYFGSGPASGRGRRWSPRQARAHLARGTVVVIAGGLGIGGVSTDVPAVKFAADIKADVVVMSKHGVEGVHAADPRREPAAARVLPEISTADALRLNLGFADRLALELSQRHCIPLRVVSAKEPGALVSAGLGEQIGSLVSPEVSERRPLDPRPLLVGLVALLSRG